MTGWSSGAVVVTGGSRGIGAAVVRRLAARRVPVCFNYRESAVEAKALCDELEGMGGEVSAVQADLAEEGDIVALFARARQNHGALWGLVNNAGYVGSAGRRVDQADAAVLRASFMVNSVAPLLCSREILRHISRRHGGEGGRIVNVSSIATRTGSPNDWVDYAASKAALNAITLGLGREVASEGVSVNGVSPGVIDTEIHSRAGDPERVGRLTSLVPAKRVGLADDVAAAVEWLLLDAPDYIQATNIDVSGGL